MNLEETYKDFYESSIFQKESILHSHLNVKFSSLLIKVQAGNRWYTQME